MWGWTPGGLVSFSCFIAFYQLTAFMWRKHFLNELSCLFRKLKTELQALRRKGALKTVPDSDSSEGRSCARCRAELGRIINRGALCKACRLRVCKGCREFGNRTTDWVCCVCQKNMWVRGLDLMQFVLACQFPVDNVENCLQGITSGHWRMDEWIHQETEQKTRWEGLCPGCWRHQANHSAIVDYIQWVES